MISNLLKATVGIVKLPVDIAADVVTMGGALTDKKEPYTVKNVKQVMKNLDDATK